MSVWASSPIIPVRFFVPELNTDILGFTCLTHRGEHSWQKFALAEDGTVFHASAPTHSKVAREVALTLLHFRALYYAGLETLQTDPVRRALIMTLADQFACVFAAFSEHWPENLNELNNALWATSLPRADFGIAWQHKEDVVLRLPSEKTRLDVVNITGQKQARPLTTRVLPITPRAMTYLNETFFEAARRAA